MVVLNNSMPSVNAQLTSRIETVKVYAAGATITRIADLQLDVGEVTQHVEIAGLPLALDDNSVHVRIEAEQGVAAIATDIRVGLAVPPRQEFQSFPAPEEVQKAKAEVQRLEDAIALIENEITVLYQLQVPTRPDGEPGKAPPASPISARLALANFSDEQIRERMQEKRETQEKLRLAQEHLNDLLVKQAQASSARDVRPNELRKTVVVRVEVGTSELSPLPATPLSNLPVQEGEILTAARQQLVVEYFVPGARWTPTYVCRIDSANNQAALAVRALICQRTGEDWSGVRLELSTAEPMAWCELPELPSLRLGRTQPVTRKLGWRKPPIGVSVLFEDFDRHKQDAIATSPTIFESAKLSSVSVSPLPKPVLYVLPQTAKREPMSPQSTRTQPSVPSDEYDITLIDPSMLAEEHNFENLEKLLVPVESESSLKRRRDSLLQQQKLLVPVESESLSNFLGYNFMRMGTPNDPTKRGKLSLEQRHEAYLEILKRQEVVVHFNVIEVVQQAVADAQNCLNVKLPPGGINVRHVAGSFDYAYNADGRVDVPSDGEFHSVALSRNNTDVDVRYVVVPRKDTNVFRIAQLRNPLQAPLLTGYADVYVDGEYILSTNIATVPPRGQMELGLGVEQAIKVARNTSYHEARSGETLVAFNELRHQIQIEIANRLSREARIEIRECLPIPAEEAKVDIQINSVSPEWEKYEQQERGVPIRGGYRWRVQVPGGEHKTLSLQYTIKTFVDSELVGGNRRE